MPPSAAGMSVVDYHAAAFPLTSAPTWRRAIEIGQVLVNGRLAPPEQALAAGDRLAFHRPPWEEPAAPTRFAVLYEDELLLAVDKPAGLQVLPGGAFYASTLLQLVRASEASRSECAPLHRLGRGTSGVILFGKTSAARARVAEQLRLCSARKTYLALTRPAELPRIARHRIGRVAHGPLTIHAAAAEGRESATRLRRLGPFAGQAVGAQCELQLVAAQPVTGRPDQIRIHLAACGAPLFGDPLFGPGGVPISDARPGEGGYFLHSASLRIRHPANGRILAVRSLPEWF